MVASALGWVGTIGSIYAYLLLSRGQWDAKSLRYSALNGVAGVLAGSAAAMYGAWPSAVSNLLWTAIAVHSAVTTLRARRPRLTLVAPVPPTDDTEADPTPARRLHLVAAA
jgi:hypothetical protein